MMRFAVLACLALGVPGTAPGFAQTTQTLRMEASPQTPRPVGPQTFGTPRRSLTAVIDLDCGTTSYRLDTGDSTSSCGQEMRDGVQVVTCSAGTTILAEANCGGGCIQVTGTGSCTINP